MKPFLTFCLLTATSFSVPVAAAEKGKTQPLAIYCAVYADGLKTVFVKTGKDSYQSVALSSANVVTAKESMGADGKVSLHGPGAGDENYPVVAIADVPGHRRALFIMAAGKKGGDMAYETKVVEGDMSDFPMGTFKMVNLAPHPVRITSGGEVVEIKAGDDYLYKQSAAAGTAVPVTIDHKAGDDWQLVSSTKWAARNDRRTLVCFLLDANSGRMVVKSVPLRGAASR